MAVSRCSEMAPLGGVAALLLLAAIALPASGNASHYQPQPQEILLSESAIAETAVGVAGGGVKLPCALGNAGGASLAIWYKEGHDKPVYTWDSRSRAPEHARHWSAPLLEGRAHFSPPAALRLNNLRAEDTGVYRCRIDFQKSPTRNTRVNLTVIIPPVRVEVHDEFHMPLEGKTRDYKEGEIIRLTCIAHGGEPAAAVSWWRGGSLLARGPLLELLAERAGLAEPLTCQATNNNITAPLSAAVHLGLLLKPLWVRIQGPKRPFSANKTTEVVCRTVGARPKPSVSWWKGATRLKSSRESISIDGNVTTSILNITPQLDDANKVLSCRAIQPSLPESGLEDGWKLEIYHVPEVRLELGSSLNAANIVEGTDVYFECNIKANPWVFKIQWFHNGELLHSNPQDGVIISNQSLVLQALRRSRSGMYVCHATNEEGEGKSNKLLLDVKFKPYCRQGQQLVYNIARNEEAKISCELQANPLDPVHFTWKFNNSEIQSTVLPASKVHVYNSASNVVPRKDGYTYAISVASYTPRNSSDYGTIMCIGANSVGQQHQPCVYHIVPAGKPDPVTNCSATNQTVNSIQVNCIEGFDGGLPQRFIVQMYNVHNNFLMKNNTFDIPQFDFLNLPSAATFDIDVFAFNKKGLSDVFNLRSHTLKEPEKQTSSVVMLLQLTPLLGVLLGCTALLVIVAIALVLMARCRRHRRTPATGQSTAKPYGEHPDGSSVPLNATDTESVDSLDKSPDILLDGKSVNRLSKNRASKLLQSPNSPKTAPPVSAKPSLPIQKLTTNPIYMPPDSPNEIFNGQYVQIDPLRYSARPPVYRLQGGQPVYLAAKVDEDQVQTEARNVYDRVYEDMLKFRGSPGVKQMDDGTLNCPELYINCTPPGQALYSSVAHNGCQSNMAGGQGVVGWFPQQQPQLVNFVAGQPQMLSRSTTPISTTRDKDYLIMSPGQKATIVPKNSANFSSGQYSFSRPNHSFDGATYTMPLMPSQRHPVVSPTMSVPPTLPVKYERLSPEEPFRSLHIRLDPPSIESKSDTLRKQRIEQTDMCEMTTDFSSQGPTCSQAETKLLETHQ